MDQLNTNINRLSNEQEQTYVNPSTGKSLNIVIERFKSSGFFGSLWKKFNVAIHRWVEVKIVSSENKTNTVYVKTERLAKALFTTKEEIISSAQKGELRLQIPPKDPVRSAFQNKNLLTLSGLDKDTVETILKNWKSLGEDKRQQFEEAVKTTVGLPSDMRIKITPNPLNLNSYRIYDQDGKQIASATIFLGKHSFFPI